MTTNQNQKPQVMVGKDKFSKKREDQNWRKKIVHSNKKLLKDQIIVRYIDCRKNPQIQIELAQFSPDYNQSRRN